MCFRQVVFLPFKRLEDTGGFSVTSSIIDGVLSTPMAGCGSIESPVSFLLNFFKLLRENTRKALRRPSCGWLMGRNLGDSYQNYQYSLRN